MICFVITMICDVITMICDVTAMICYPARALRALGLLLAHSGTGRDFLARNGMSRTKTAVTRKRSDRDGRVQRQNGANGEGYKRPVDKKRGPISKNGFSGRNPEFLARKKMFTFGF